MRPNDCEFRRISRYNVHRWLKLWPQVAHNFFRNLISHPVEQKFTNLSVRNYKDNTQPVTLFEYDAVCNIHWIAWFLCLFDRKTSWIQLYEKQNFSSEYFTNICANVKLADRDGIRDKHCLLKIHSLTFLTGKLINHFNHTGLVS